MDNQPGSGRRAREMRKYRRTELLILFLIVAVLAVFFLVLYLGKLHKVWDPNDTQISDATTTAEFEEWEKNHVSEVISTAELIAQGYDFDAAIDFIKNDELYKKNLSMLEKVEELQNRKKDMVAWPDVKTITHLTIRPLIANNGIIFSSDTYRSTYGQNYITTNEFRSLLQELYDKGYVLVSLHDISYSKNYINSFVEETTTEEETTLEVTGENVSLNIETTEETTIEETTTEETTEEETGETSEGETTEEATIELITESTTADPRVLKKGKIMLPAGKTPIVLSQENSCYTESLSSLGFASKLILQKDGSLACQLADGSIGAYDFVPILEEFIALHPDFSYCGARAVLGVSGGDGVFGYKTSYLYNDNPGYDEEVNQAKQVADALKQKGYEIAMNGYHYANMGPAYMDMATFKNEMKNWFDEVAPIVGTTDIMMFPNGDDIGDWRYYSGERYELLFSYGFAYYLNMNSSERAWNQLLSYYLRQGRRLVTGKEIEKEMNGAGNFLDVFDANKLYDPVRLIIE